VKSDTFIQGRMGAFTVIVEEMAWQILLWLLWCGSNYHMLVCGKQFSSILRENHRENSVLPTDEETTTVCVDKWEVEGHSRTDRDGEE